MKTHTRRFISYRLKRCFMLHLLCTNQLNQAHCSNIEVKICTITHPQWVAITMLGVFLDDIDLHKNAMMVRHLSSLKPVPWLLKFSWKHYLTKTFPHFCYQLDGSCLFGKTVGQHNWWHTFLEIILKTLMNQFQGPNPDNTGTVGAHSSDWNALMMKKRPNLNDICMWTAYLYQ